ncbi:hypothetical protein [Candidatus Poriferisocius sp.]|uniref:hypothetical protein n=1 Tax=Candidatus Poriferisocius sp. TaxID=3101276 RepID=UPI003B01D8B7
MTPTATLTNNHPPTTRQSDLKNTPNSREESETPHPDTSYNYGYFDLGPDEAWIIEFEPPECEYWNIQLGNHWLESLDFEYYQTNLNHHTAAVEDDGSVRVVVARQDPGHPNWLDTAGHARGGLALRWVGADNEPEVRCRVEEL